MNEYNNFYTLYILPVVYLSKASRTEMNKLSQFSPQGCVKLWWDFRLKRTHTNSHFIIFQCRVTSGNDQRELFQLVLIFITCFAIPSSAKLLWIDIEFDGHVQLVAWNNAGTFACINTSPLGLLIVLNAKASGMRCVVAEIWKKVVDALSS